MAETCEREIDAAEALLSLRYSLPPRPPKRARSETHLPTAMLPPRPPLRATSTARMAPAPTRISVDLVWRGKGRRRQLYRKSVVERKEAECGSPLTPLDCYVSSTSGSGTGSVASPPSESSSAGEVRGWVPPAARRPRSQTRVAKGKFLVQDLEPMQLDYGVETELGQGKISKRLKKSVRAEVPDLNYPPPSRP